MQGLHRPSKGPFILMAVDSVPTMAVGAKSTAIELQQFDGFSSQTVLKMYTYLILGHLLAVDNASTDDCNLYKDGRS